MSKRSNALESLPSAVQAQLRDLGENLAIARKRRRETRKAWAERIGVSEPTLMRMEKGDPSVSMGVYATALWLMGRASSLPDLAAPEHDQAALEDAVRVAKSRASRKPVSIYRLSPSEALQRLDGSKAFGPGMRASAVTTAPHDLLGADLLSAPK